jgi:hypothetical protein
LWGGPLARRIAGRWPARHDPCGRAVTAYRGLSGIDSALFALLLWQERRSRLAILCAVAFAAKIAFEVFAGATVFVARMGTDVVPVPIAHVAGAMTVVLGISPLPNPLPTAMRLLRGEGKVALTSWRGARSVFRLRPRRE